MVSLGHSERSWTLDTKTVVNSDSIRTRSPNSSVESETGKVGLLIGVLIGSLTVIDGEWT